MIEKKRIEEAQRNAKQYIDEGLLKVKDKDAPRFVGFFMKNAESSLQTASMLQEISDQQAPYLNVSISAMRSSCVCVRTKVPHHHNSTPMTVRFTTVAWSAVRAWQSL